MMIKIVSYKSPVGDMILGDYEGSLCLADWQYRKMRSQIDKRIKHFFQTEYQSQETRLHQQAIQQLEEYFSEKRQIFELPLVLAGTDFQQTVWQILMKISYGSTKSYLQLSKMLGQEKAIRAVAAANGANAISIIIPCHRIIGSDGSLTGYAGGLTAKKKLLTLESKSITNTLFD